MGEGSEAEEALPPPGLDRLLVVFAVICVGWFINICFIDDFQIAVQSVPVLIPEYL